MNIYLDDTLSKETLIPFTYTRHTADIRFGIMTLREKWEQLTSHSIYTDPLHKEGAVIIPANIIPSEDIVDQIITFYQDHPAKVNSPDFEYLTYPWEIFQQNARAITSDFPVITRGLESAALPAGSSVRGNKTIFIGKNVQIEQCHFYTGDGPIYIGDNVTIMAGALIRGPFAACNGATVKMGAKIYAGTTLGPNCVGGGEIKNSMFFGNSNKAHDGYLGDSVIGEWCNLGAGTSNSNLKNTAGEVFYSLTAKSKPVSAGNKAGLLMADYSRSAINTSFNTGSVVGVCCNIFGSMPPKYVNHFSWGQEKYEFEKAIKDIGNWKKMKGAQVTNEEVELLKEIYLNY